MIFSTIHPDLFSPPSPDKKKERAPETGTRSLKIEEDSYS